MVSDSDLGTRLGEVLHNSDLNTATAGSIRRQLEAEFGEDLSNRKAFITAQIDSYLENLEANQASQNEAVTDPSIEEPGEGQNENGFSVRKKESEDHSEDEDNDEECQVPTSKKSRISQIGKDVQKKGSGFTKLCGLSQQLQKFTGETELARTEVVKKLWAYIREKNLQHPQNKRKIICDEALHALFSIDSIDMFQMNKALSKHILPLNESGALDSSAQKNKESKKMKEEDDSDDESKQREKQEKKKLSGFLAPLPLSDALIKFIGTGEKALSRSDVVKKMWDYIKGNNLQDPSDKRRIICDDKLKELLQRKTFTGFAVSKLLSPHFIRKEQ